MSRGQHAPGGVPRRAIALGLFVVASLGVGLLAYTQGWINPELIQRTVAESGSLAMVAYVISVVVLELLWVPRAWGLFAGGVLFGPVYGCLLSLVADMIGALLCYFLGRGGGRKWVRSLLETRPRAARVVALLAERRGGLTVAFLRVTPVAHYTVVSYAAGVAGVPVLAFVLGNAVGIIPGAILYPLIGSAALNPSSPTFIIGVSVLAVAFVASLLIARWYLKAEQRSPASR